MRGLSKKLESLQASFGIAKKQGDGVSQIVAEFESAIAPTTVGRYQDFAKPCQTGIAYNKIKFIKSKKTKFG